MTDTQYAPLRLCDSCLVVDGDPRHVYGVRGDASEQVTYTDEQRTKAIEATGGNAEKLSALIRDLGDAGTQAKHLDCCLADGCPDGTCQNLANDPDHPFDGGKTTGVELSKKLAAHVAKLNQKGN
jgi:hypothetical protein